MPPGFSSLIDFIGTCWFGVIGACVGSFLNVVAYRMPLGISVIWKPSHCPKCKTPIETRDNVPVLGWLWLRGKCRSCGAPISPRYAIVEAVMGLTFFVLAYAEVFSGGANLPLGPLTETTGVLANVLEPNWTLLGVYAYHCALLSLLMCVVLVDLDDKPVPVSWATVLILVFLLNLFWRPGATGGLASVNGGLLIFAAVVAAAIDYMLKRYGSDRCHRKNLSFAIAANIFFLGFAPLPTLVAIAIVFAVFLLLVRPIRVYLQGRVFPSSWFAAALLQIVFWKQLHALIVS